MRRGSSTHVAATLTYDPSRLRVTINPRSSLRAGTTYRVVVTTKVKDVAGNRLDQNGTRPFRQAKTWKFTTR